MRRLALLLLSFIDSFIFYFIFLIGFMCTIHMLIDMWNEKVLF